MQREAVLVQLGYVPNEALLKQLEKIEENTQGFEKIQKHIIDLHSHLRVDDAYVAMSNSNDCFKIKIDTPSPEMAQEAHEKIESTTKAIEKVEKKIETTNKQATKKQAAKEASAAISVETAPAPDLSNVGFSVDCKTRMTEMLDDLESEFSHAELLCLAGLIRARYTPIKE